MATYYKHNKLNIVVKFAAIGRCGDTFRGVVVESDESAAAIGTYSDTWIRDAFTPCEWSPAAAAIPADTVESLQAENDMLRIALGVEIEPLATLPERMLRAATVYRKLFVKVKAAVDESR